MSDERPATPADPIVMDGGPNIVGGITHDAFAAICANNARLDREKRAHCDSIKHDHPWFVPFEGHCSCDCHQENHYSMEVSGER